MSSILLHTCLSGHEKLNKQTLVAEKSSGATIAIHKDPFLQRIFGPRR